MAYQLCAFSWSISIFLTLASITYCSGFGFWGSDRTDLDYVCSQTSNPSRCTELFRSDYRSSTTDIRGLTEIAIELAYNRAQQNSQVNFGYHQGNNDPSYSNPDYNNGYNNGHGTGYNPGHNSGSDYGRGDTGYNNQCTKYYNQVIKDMEKARDYLRKGEYRKITSNAENALKQVRKCRDVLSNNGELELLCQMVQFSSKRFNREF